MQGRDPTGNAIAKQKNPLHLPPLRIFFLLPIKRTQKRANSAKEETALRPAIARAWGIIVRYSLLTLSRSHAFTSLYSDNWNAKVSGIYLGKKRKPKDRTRRERFLQSSFCPNSDLPIDLLYVQLESHYDVQLKKKLFPTSNFIIDSH